MLETSADLAVALAGASDKKGFELPADFVAVVEVGFAGEISKVAEARRRIMEAAELGFKLAIVPASRTLNNLGIEIKEIFSWGKRLQG